MNVITGMLDNMGFALVYIALGLSLPALGFWALDVMTPGRLAEHIFKEESVNAAVVAAAGMLGLGMIAFTTIWTNSTAGFGDALVWTIGFGLLGVAAQAVAFLLLSLLTAGHIKEVVCQKDFHPGSLVAAAGQIVTALIVVASIA